MKFCDTEIIDYKDPNDTIVDLKILSFVIEAIKSGANNIEVTVKDTLSFHRKTLSLFCDSVIDTYTMSHIAGGFPKSEVVINSTKTSETYCYFYHMTKSINHILHKTKINEQPSKGYTSTSLDTWYLKGKNGPLGEFYNHEVYIYSSFITKIMDFVSIYLELVPNNQPNILFNLYPEVTNEKHTLAVKTLNLLDTGRHDRQFIDNYQIDYFFVPKREGVRYFNYETFLLKKEGDDIFQLRYDNYPPIIEGTILNYIGYNEYRYSDDTSGIVAVIS